MLFQHRWFCAFFTSPVRPCDASAVLLDMIYGLFFRFPSGVLKSAILQMFCLFFLNMSLIYLHFLVLFPSWFLRWNDVSWFVVFDNLAVHLPVCHIFTLITTGSTNWQGTLFCLFSQSISLSSIEKRIFCTLSREITTKIKIKKRGHFNVSKNLKNSSKVITECVCYDISSEQFKIQIKDKKLHFSAHFRTDI